jgi:hypothetical protein
MSMDDDEWERTAVRLRTAKTELRRLLAGREQVVDEIVHLLFERDPIGINFESNTDEYEPEAETITLRLQASATVDDVIRIVHEEFVHWFGAETAGPQARYKAIAGAIWNLWQRFRAESTH